MLARLEERGKELRQLSQEQGRFVQPFQIQTREEPLHTSPRNTLTSLPIQCNLLLMLLFGQMTGSLQEPEPLYHGNSWKEWEMDPRQNRPDSSISFLIFWVV